jgi:DNA mismatch endonuclease (patch repair protein)
MVIVPKKIAIFIDSCFWHGCKKHCRIPTANQEYWINKINRNKERDKEVNAYYKKRNRKIIRIWEHDLKNEKRVINKIKKLIEK